MPFFHLTAWNIDVVTSHLGLVGKGNNIKIEEQQDKRGLVPEQLREQSCHTSLIMTTYECA